MYLDLELTESEKMLKRTALDFMRREVPNEIVDFAGDGHGLYRGSVA